MSFKIKVDPEAVKALTEKARLIPNERMEAALNKLADLETTLLTWKGNSKESYEDVHAYVHESLVSTQELMNAMLIALDKSIEEFSYTDVNVSERFERIVDSYTTK